MNDPILYEHAPLKIFQVGPDGLRVVERSTPMATCSSLCGSPAAAFGAFLLFGGEHISFVAGLAGALLAITALVFLYAITYSVTVRISRSRVDRVYWVFGIPISSSLRYDPTCPPSVDVERTSYRARTAGMTHTAYAYRARVRVGGQGMALGPARDDERIAENDCAEIRRFFDGLQGTVRVESGEARAPPAAFDSAAWTYPLAPFEASGDCPMCRDALVAPEALVVCTDCRTGYHQECAQELGRCGTLGCRNHQRRRQTS